MSLGAVMMLPMNVFASADAKPSLDYAQVVFVTATQSSGGKSVEVDLSQQQGVDFEVVR